MTKLRKLAEVILDMPHPINRTEDLNRLENLLKVQLIELIEPNFDPKEPPLDLYNVLPIGNENDVYDMGHKEGRLDVLRDLFQ